MEKIKFTDEEERLVMSRAEIMDVWQKQTTQLNDPCCPNCRDLLFRNINGDFYCENPLCAMPGEDGRMKHDRYITIHR